MSFNNLTFRFFRFSRFSRFFLVVVCLAQFSGAAIFAQDSSVYVLTAETLEKEKSVELSKAGWKYRAGDDLSWANPQFDDSDWAKVEETVLKPDLTLRPEWRGRAWFRLRLKVDDALKDKTFAFMMRQIGASEVYIDNRKIAAFGTISDDKIIEENPNRAPITFRFEAAGEHTIAVRYASATFADMTSAQARWLTNGTTYPLIMPAIKDAGDQYETVLSYADATAMRGGFLFFGVLSALALLHFLFYIFYRVERANLFYSIYAVSFGSYILINNYRFYGHLAPNQQIFLSIIGVILLAATFLALLVFVHVAFNRRIGKFFWLLTVIWAFSIFLNGGFLAKYGGWGIVPTFAAIGLTFAFCIIVLVKALREKRPGAWILMTGVQLLILGMTLSLINQIKLVSLPGEFALFSELSIMLGVPLAVSVYLARNFARTNRDLSAQLVQIEQLSAQKIEHERHAAELRAENERRAKELEEARQLQLSMLPRKLPQMPNLEIAAYMKPASEVGGDYYDFHVGADGGLTVAVGDATGHGLKAGTVVTAAKTLFRNYADEANIPDVFRKSSRVIKEMNLRGLFMAMTMLKIKDDRLSICVAGMPSALVYRAETESVEEIAVRAMPWGSPFAAAYEQHEFTLRRGDAILLMSDGFPEMFSENGEMIGDAAAAQTLRESAHLAAQEIIDRLIETGEKWAGARPQDDDITFVVMKVV